MLEEFKQEEINKLIDELPEDIKETLFSLETADTINNASKMYELEDEEITELTDCVALTLLGIIPLSDFQKTIKERAKLTDSLAKTISQQITRLIFYPVKNSLEELQKIETSSGAKSEKTLNKQTGQDKEPFKPSGKDVYREPIE
ncbi:MAG: hypothetical protein PHF44_01105 [Candidatus Pacebacteria bacterium]|nr:hypothetical protein [Candidatus Paceibacterota bacterium]